MLMRQCDRGIWLKQPFHLAPLSAICPVAAWREEPFAVIGVRRGASVCFARAAEVFQSCRH